jgi:D-glycerate 3-kinase
MDAMDIGSLSPTAPMALNCEEVIRRQIADWTSKKCSSCPLIIGLSGPQGSGKSTLCSRLSSPSIAVLSLDDFYWPFKRQKQLAIETQGKPLLELRGNPGTHDLSLLLSTLKAVMQRRVDVPMPKYDKSQKSGRGDRMDQRDWSILNASKVTCIIIEGWCIGFAATEDHDELSRIALSFNLTPEHLSAVNDHLRAYVSLHEQMNALIHMRAQDLQYVYDWRWEQELSLKRAKGDNNAGMSQSQTKDFVDRLMPMYHVGLPSLEQRGFFNLKTRSGETLQITLSKSRSILDINVYAGGLPLRDHPLVTNWPSSSAENAPRT